MGNFETANALAILTAGRNPSWSEQASYDGAPSSSSAGIYLEDAPSTLVAVDLRTNVHRRQVDVSVATYDAAADFTVSINGNSVTVLAAAHSTEPGLLTTLRDDINADGTVGALVTVVALDANGEDVATSGEDAVSLVVTGDGEADFYVGTSATGSGALAVEADAVSCDVRCFGLVGGAGTDKPGGWRQLNGSKVTSLDYRGFMERYVTGGISRMYVELDNVAGHASDSGTITYRATVSVGPGVEE